MLIYLRRWPNPSPIYPVKGVSIIRLSQKGWFLFGTKLEDLIMLSRFEGETSEGILLAILSLDWECFDECNFHDWLLLSIMKYRLMAFISRARGYDVFFVAFAGALPLWDDPGDSVIEIWNGAKFALDMMMIIFSRYQKIQVLTALFGWSFSHISHRNSYSTPDPLMLRGKLEIALVVALSAHSLQVIQQSQLMFIDMNKLLGYLWAVMNLSTFCALIFQLYDSSRVHFAPRDHCNINTQYFTT